MMRITTLFFLMIFVLFAAAPSLFAQDEGPEGHNTNLYDPESSDLYIKNLAEDDDDIIQEIRENATDDYVEPTMENLAKMYWAIGKFDIAEDKLIDYFLMISECEMYMQYYHNDFEWAKIENATRDYIMANMGKFPTHFEMIIPLPLGRYNQEKQEFEVAEENKLKSIRRLDLAMNQRGRKEVCTRSGDIIEYPPNIVVILNRPFSLEKVPVRRELAKLYIEEAKSFYNNLPLRLQLMGYERLSFLRLKIKITQYKNTERIIGGDLRAFVFGRLEGYELYADQDKKKPLYFENLEGKRFRRLRKARHTLDEQTNRQPKVYAPGQAAFADGATGSASDSENGSSEDAEPAMNLVPAGE